MCQSSDGGIGGILQADNTPPALLTQIPPSVRLPTDSFWGFDLSSSRGAEGV